MTITELSQILSSQGLYPIRVEGDASRDENEGLVFIGAFDEYCAAVKVLGTKAIFLFVSELDETDFSYGINSDHEDDLEYGDDDSDLDEKHEKEDIDMQVDLCLALPSLSEFKKHIGSECAFRLSAIGELADLDFYIEENWWLSFASERDKAIKKVEEDQDAIRKKMYAKLAERKKVLIKLIRGLLNDTEFVRMPTQRSMKAYALEKYPELNEMNDFELVQEIQSLNDKIKAKGLYKRQR